MRVSIIVAAHNEGSLLWKTVRSCVETTPDLNREIIVANDASTDGCVEEARRRYPEVRVVSFPCRRGCSAAKDLGARRARGRVLVFLDRHCKPEEFAIERLVNDVEDLEGQAIVTPTVPALDVARWRSSKRAKGHGYVMSLSTFHSKWLPLERLRRIGPLYECPALVGCCLAISKKLYLELRGFDPDMIEWGVEDVDLGLKAWFLGRSVLHDPYAMIGHRFRSAFSNFTVRSESILANEIRTARKNFSESLWREWRRRMRRRTSTRLWKKAWASFETRRTSAEEEREYLQARRVHSETWYAHRFGLKWPRARLVRPERLRLQAP
jgi:GT2 family glycosyltransferase